MMEAPLPLPEKKPADRFWWLPILLVPALIYCCGSIPKFYDRFFPAPPNIDSGQIEQVFCATVLFLNSIPGRLVICFFLSAPAIILLIRRTVNWKSKGAIPLIAYLSAAIIGLIGTVRLVPYRLYIDPSGHIINRAASDTQLGLLPGDGQIPQALLTLAEAAPLLAIIALIFGWYHKRIRLVSGLTPILSAIFVILNTSTVQILGACSPGILITTP